MIVIIGVVVGMIAGRLSLWFLITCCQILPIPFTILVISMWIVTGFISVWSWSSRRTSRMRLNMDPDKL